MPKNKPKTDKQIKMELDERIRSGNLDTLGAMPAGRARPMPKQRLPSESFWILANNEAPAVSKIMSQYLSYDIAPCTFHKSEGGYSIYMNSKYGRETLIGEIIFSPMANGRIALRRVYETEQNTPEYLALLKVTNGIRARLREAGFTESEQPALTKDKAKAEQPAPPGITETQSLGQLEGKIKQAYDKLQEAAKDTTDENIALEIEPKSNGANYSIRWINQARNKMRKAGIDV